MLKKLYILFALLIVVVGCGSHKQNIEKKPLIIVSIAPYAKMVEQIAGDTVDTIIAVPAGGDPHVFETTPKHMMKFQDASAWIGVGERFEKQILPSINKQNSKFIYLNLSEKVPLLKTQGHTGCEHCDGSDRHIWLDPILDKQQLQEITSLLVKINPIQKDLYLDNLIETEQKLVQLDNAIKTNLLPCRGSGILVVHAAFGYFCHEYGIKQIALEQEDKETLPKDLTSTLDSLENESIVCAIGMPQHPVKALGYLAEKLSIPLYSVDPYQKDYIATIEQLETFIEESCQKSK